MAREGGSNYAHRGLSVILRLGELASAVIVLGILARFCYVLSTVSAKANGRIVYALVIAGIGIVYSIIFGLPFNVLFMSFPFDFIMFVAWLVAFALLVDQSPHCSTDWFNNYWGYYWGRYYRWGPIDNVTVRGAGCGYWKTALAFAFIAAMGHLMSFILGIYVFRTYINVKETVASAKQQAEKLRKPSHGGQQSKRSATPPSPMAQTAAPVAPGAPGAPGAPVEQTNPQRPVEQV